MSDDKKANDNLPVKLAKPAQRALTNEGIKTLKQLSKLTEEELAKLHGIGPNALEQIRKAFAEKGLTFNKKKK
ncbi:MAG: DNA-binding protein [Fimbriimonadaceae bacterium]|nr:DNA-binding protein [Chitinophagales bacterium]